MNDKLIAYALHLLAEQLQEDQATRCGDDTRIELCLKDRNLPTDPEVIFKLAEEHDPEIASER